MVKTHLPPTSQLPKLAGVWVVELEEQARLEELTLTWAKKW